MDVDFWTSSDHSVKLVSASAASQFKAASEEARAFFPCPFCYIDIELPVFCTHLQEEHCFDLRNAVCPLCAENLGKSPVEHFTMQHTQSVKRRRKQQKSGIWAMDQPSSGKELRDISSILDSTSRISMNNNHEADSLLSPFLFHTPRPSSNNYLQDKDTFETKKFAMKNVKRNTWKLEDERKQQDDEEKKQRKLFIEDLVMSTIF